MKNRSAAKIALIMSCILTIGMILLSVWYSRSLEEESTSFKKSTEYVVTETPSNAKTPKTTVHTTPVSDSAAVHTQQTNDEPIYDTLKQLSPSAQDDDITNRVPAEPDEALTEDDKAFMEEVLQEWNRLESQLKNAAVESVELYEILTDIDKRLTEAVESYTASIAGSGISIEEYNRELGRITQPYTQEQAKFRNRASKIDRMLYDEEILVLFGDWPREGGRILHEYLESKE